MILYVKKNDSLNAISIPYISSLEALHLYTTDVRTDPDRYIVSGIGSSYTSISIPTTGYCKNLLGTSTILCSTTTQSRGLSDRCVTRSASATSGLYPSYMRTHMNSNGAILDSLSNDEDSLIYLCDSSGNEILSINSTFSSTSASVVINILDTNGTFSLPTIFSSYINDASHLYIYAGATSPASFYIGCFSELNNTGSATLSFYSQIIAIDPRYPDTTRGVFFNALQLNGADPNEIAGQVDVNYPDGGSGDYDFPSTDIDTNDIPDENLSNLIGFINPYCVTGTELLNLGTFLWSANFFDNIAKTFSNPMDCIISLSSFPVASSSMSLGSSENVRVGNTTSSSTGTRLISEFITINCGTISVPEVWGSYLDYAQTKLYIYIPYLGIEELPLCECMGGNVACELRINLLTGALVACVTLTSGTYVTGSARVQPIYFSTTCKSDIPVSGATTGALAGAFQLLGGAVSSVAGIATGVAPLAISGLASAAQGVATMQSQNSQISGAVGAAGGQMAHKIPFLIFDRPVQSVPANLASIAGYQSNSGTTLSKCSGYVICDTINLDGLALTRSELEEVEQICTSGVYIS